MVRYPASNLLHLLSWRSDSASAERFLEYESRIQTLEAANRQHQRRQASYEANNNATTNAEASQGVALAADNRPGISRFGSFMHSRKVTPTSNGLPQSPSGREKQLELLLAKEQERRVAAEQRAQTLDAELEDLTAKLFEEANEMVASERRQNATLEERLQMAERKLSQQSDVDGVEHYVQENVKLRERIKILEQRDTDRRRRLEKLDAASKRVERVRALLIPR